jgi:hypothetical protein
MFTNVAASVAGVITLKEVAQTGQAGAASLSKNIVSIGKFFMVYNIYLWAS